MTSCFSSLLGLFHFFLEIFPLSLLFAVSIDLLISILMIVTHAFEGKGKSKSKQKTVKSNHNNNTGMNKKIHNMIHDTSIIGCAVIRHRK